MHNSNVKVLLLAVDLPRTVNATAAMDESSVAVDEGILYNSYAYN